MLSKQLNLPTLILRGTRILFEISAVKLGSEEPVPTKFKSEPLPNRIGEESVLLDMMMVEFHESPFRNNNDKINFQILHLKQTMIHDYSFT